MKTKEESQQIKVFHLTFTTLLLQHGSLTDFVPRLTARRKGILVSRSYRPEKGRNSVRLNYIYNQNVVIAVVSYLDFPSCSG